MKPPPFSTLLRMATLDSPSLNQLTLYLMDLRIFLQGFSWMDKEQSVMDIHTM